MIKIGKTAAKLFNDKGYLETSMNNISYATKISKGGIYHYFNSKNEILYFILTNYLDLGLQNFEQELQNNTEGFSKIQFIISRQIELYIKNISECKTLLHEVHNLPPKYLKVIAEKEKRYFQIVSGVLSDFLGYHIGKSQLTAITFSLFGMCNWIYSWYNPEGPITPQELSEIIYNIFSKGVSSYRQLKNSEPSENQLKLNSTPDHLKKCLDNFM